MNHTINPSFHHELRSQTARFCLIGQAATLTVWQAGPPSHPTGPDPLTKAVRAGTPGRPRTPAQTGRRAWSERPAGQQRRRATVSSKSVAWCRWAYLGDPGNTSTGTLIAPLWRPRRVLLHTHCADGRVLHWEQWGFGVPGLGCRVWVAPVSPQGHPPGAQRSDAGTRSLTRRSAAS